MSLKVVFMGTPEFAVASLSALAEAYDVALVLTRPDAVSGRGRQLRPSPVKQRALELGLSVLEARKIGTEQIDAIGSVRPDVVVVAAYGAILPDELTGFDLAHLGAINVHGSLLPRWRGAAPIQRAMLAGDRKVGISIMRMVHELDAGPWCRQASIEVGDKGAEEIMAGLAALGAQELVGALEDIAAGTAIWHEQDEKLVSYAKKVKKAEMLLSPKDPAILNLRRVRAATDAAPARILVGTRGVRILDAQLVSSHDLAFFDKSIATAQLVCFGRRVLLGCSEGTLELLSVKPDGKRAMKAAEWALGLHANLTWGEI